MKKRIAKFISIVSVVSIVFSTQAFAINLSGKVLLKKSTVSAQWAQKTTNTDKLAYDLLNVYPTDGSKDTYTRIKIGAVYNPSKRYVLMPTRVIYEQDNATTYSYPKNLSKGDYVAFTLAGNDPTLEAYADIWLNWY